MVSPLRLRWLEDVYVFRFNLSPAFLAEWPGCFTCYCDNTWVERTPNKRQYIKLTLERKKKKLWRRKFFRHFCRDSNPQPCDHESGALTNKLPSLPCVFRAWPIFTEQTCAATGTSSRPTASWILASSSRSRTLVCTTSDKARSSLRMKTPTEVITVSVSSTA